MEEVVLIPNAPILIESTRSIGYSFETAIADIIDNSIAKKAKNIHLYFDVDDEPFIVFLDDGIGMSFEELTDAMRYGSRNSLDERDEDDLGRFGLGMKTASLSQCRKLSVFSKKNEMISGATWDLDYVIQKNEWALISYDIEECHNNRFFQLLEGYDSGTIVIWEKFDRLENSTTNFEKTFNQKIEQANHHVALVFHRFMSNENKRKRIHIFFNNNEIKPLDPFLLDNPATQPLSEQTIMINNQIIKVKPYILPYPSKISSKEKKLLGDLDDLRRTQGFYIYRNKRLIIWGTWFKLIKSYELNKLARVRVDIPNALDSIWEIDIKKSSASLPDSIKKNLVNIVQNTVGKSERVYKYRGRKLNSEIIHVWDVINERGKYKYQINKDMPIYKELVSHLDEKGETYFHSFIQMIENSFPFEDIFYRMGKEEINVKNDTLEFNQVYDVGVDMIQAVRDNNVNLAEFIDSFKYIDFFQEYPNVIKKLKEDYISE